MPASRRPRVGFLGLGWIGRHRMEAIRGCGAVEIAGLADVSDEMVAASHAIAPEAERVVDLDALLAMRLDGVVIATPSAQHAEQVLRALAVGTSVFCQKPLGRTGNENSLVIAAARQANRLLNIDLCYRHTAGMQRLGEIVSAGELGTVYAVDLSFHNAYGPNKDWFYDRKLSGGGCVIDLGIHLVDLALWSLGWPKVTHVESDLFTKGRRLQPPMQEVEDFAVATLKLDNGTVVRLACSWDQHAGQDADIAFDAYGSAGSLAFHNVDGSFYDFVLEKRDKTTKQTLIVPPDDWGGRAAIMWAQQLARSPEYDPEIERLIEVSETIDRIYDAGAS